MLRLSGIATAAGADRGSAMAVEASSPPGTGPFARLARSHLTSAPASAPYNAQRPSGPAAQRPSGPAAQRPSGPAAQRPSGPAAQRPSGPAAQRPSGPAAQRPSGPAAQRPSGPAAQRPSGMTCARRQAGARKPAPPTSASSPRTPDARTGRARARRFARLLPALALLLGALSLVAPELAQAQETVGVSNHAKTKYDTVKFQMVGLR